MIVKKIIVPSLILFFICLITATALAGTNLLTADRILQQEIEAAKRSQQNVLPAAVSFENVDGYSIGINTEGEIEGYTFTTYAKGYGGEIAVMTGIYRNGKISGVTILSHGETPGLGANAANSEFCEQFEEIDVKSGATVTKSSPQEGEIAAVTGATISSEAVTSAVNEALSLYEKVKEA